MLQPYLYLYENNWGLNVENIKLPGFKELAANMYEYVPLEYFIKATKQVLLESLFKFIHIAILSDHFLLKSTIVKFL